MRSYNLYVSKRPEQVIARKRRVRESYVIESQEDDFSLIDFVRDMAEQENVSEITIRKYINEEEEDFL